MRKPFKLTTEEIAAVNDMLKDCGQDTDPASVICLGPDIEQAEGCVLVLKDGPHVQLLRDFLIRHKLLTPGKPIIVGATKDPEAWAAEQIWPSREAIDNALKCPRPHGGIGGCHWWYNHNEDEEDSNKSCLEGYTLIVCKTCSLVLKLSVDAPEFPDI